MCNPILPTFRNRKVERYFLFSRCCLFWAKKDNPLPCATLFTDFSESKKSQKIFAAQTPQHYTCVWLTFSYFGRKRIIHFHLRLYSPTFRRRKSCKSRSPLRRRSESAATWGISPTATNYASEISKILVSHYPQSCIAKSPRDKRADGVGF